MQREQFIAEIKALAQETRPVENKPERAKRHDSLRWIALGWLMGIITCAAAAEGYGLLEQNQQLRAELEILRSNASTMTTSYTSGTGLSAGQDYHQFHVFPKTF